MKLMPAWALGKPDLVGRISASTAYMVARMNCPMNLPLTVSPSLCFLRTFAKSSMNPKNPIDSMANSTNTADHDGTSPLVRNRYSAEEHQPEHHREVDDHAAKRRRAALDEMRLRAILTDVLSVIELVHQLNQQRSAHNRHDERHHNADDE